MLIEQIAEFDMRGPKPLVIHISVFLKLVIFMAKQKSSSELFNVKNVAEGNVQYLASPDLGQVTKFKP